MWDKPRETYVKLNPKIEAFASYRDNIHKNFKFTKKNTFYTFIFLGAFSFFFLSKFKQDTMRRQKANGVEYSLMSTTFSHKQDEKVLVRDK
ncbi:hypothetical protein ABK040_008897 [Willaertia magna]